MKRILSLTVLALAALGAQAQTMKFNSVDLGRAVTISGDLNATVFAGRLNFTDSSFGDVKTYCVDLGAFIHVGQEYMVSHEFSDTQTQGLRNAGNIVSHAYGAADDNDKAAGLQLAIWEAIYDGGSVADFSHGHFKAEPSSQVVNYANQFYALRTQEGKARMFKACDVGQSQMDCVPEPASLAALFIGGIGLVRRRAKK